VEDLLEDEMDAPEFIALGNEAHAQVRERLLSLSEVQLGTKVYAYKADGTLAWQFSIAHSVLALAVAE